MLNKCGTSFKLFARSFFASKALFSDITYEKQSSIVLIGMNKPDKRNALDEIMIEDLQKAIDRFENDDEAPCAVLYGEGGNFCAGYDLKELAKSECIPKHFVHSSLTERFSRKPVIAAINGYAVGSGLDLAIWCDLRVMEESAVLGCFERRFGISISECGIGRLQSIVGLSRAMDLIVTGRSVKSAEALNIGLVNRVVECGMAVGQALSLGINISKFRQASVLTDRAVLYKHAFSKIPLKNSEIDEDSLKYKEEVLKDSKKGAELFADGAGKKGYLFSSYLWNK